MARLPRILMLAAGWICCGLGCIGIFVPVLPTTPLILLAGFLFAKSSPRMTAWLQSTKVYRAYVEPFKAAGGMSRGAKIRALGISYAVLAISAAVVHKPFVWAILACVAVFLMWLIGFHIKTIANTTEGPKNVCAPKTLEEFDA